ncbi:MAG: hypothetical protein JNL38_28095 [Myxococcales bacterium]|jgi:hypothetical protein|nr:hypothetical protein [Myxococcales bacterium]
MKRTSWILGVIALAALAHCSAKPPKQADSADPVTEGGSSSGSSGSSGGTTSSGGGSGGGSSSGDPLSKPGPVGSSKGPVDKTQPAQVTTLAAMVDGLKWGINPEELIKEHTKVGGIIWKDYDKQLLKASGPQVQALEGQRQHEIDAVDRNYISFDGARPVGLDSSGLKSEYSYKNGEGLVFVEGRGTKTYFFFFGVDRGNGTNKKQGRMWKIYKEYKLAADGPMGKDFLSAVNKLNGQFGVLGRVQNPTPENGVAQPTVDWVDAAGIHVRVVDRSGEGVVGVVAEEMSTVRNLTALRPNKMVDPTEMDPSIAALTAGSNRVDPNAARAAASGSASGKPKGTPPKK